MEANIIVKAEDLTPDFADGIRKVFSSGAVLHIKVEYGMNGTPEAPAPKKRGPKPKGSTEAPAAAPTGKKRGRKPGPKPGPKPATDGLPKKRGPKPKNPVE